MTGHLHGPECARTLPPDGVTQLDCEKGTETGVIWPLNIQQSAVVIRPGDTLIIRVDPTSSKAHVLELRDQVREHLPDDVDLLVIACEDLAVAIREDLAAVRDEVEEPPR